MAPAIVVPRMLKRNGLRFKPMDLIEIHAFARLSTRNLSMKKAPAPPTMSLRAVQGTAH